MLDKFKSPSLKDKHREQAKDEGQENKVEKKLKAKVVENKNKKK